MSTCPWANHYPVQTYLLDIMLGTPSALIIIHEYVTENTCTAAVVGDLTTDNCGTPSGALTNADTATLLNALLPNCVASCASGATTFTYAGDFKYCMFLGHCMVCVICCSEKEC